MNNNQRISKYVCLINFNVYYDTGYVDILRNKVYYLRRQQHDPPIKHYNNFEWSLSNDNLIYQPYLGSDFYSKNTLCVLSDYDVSTFFITLSEWRENQIEEIFN